MRGISSLFFLLSIIFLSTFAQEGSEKKDLTADGEFLLIQKEYLKKIEKRKEEYQETLEKVILTDPDTVSLVVLIAPNLPLLSVGTYNNNIRLFYSLEWAAYLEMKSNEKPTMDIDKIRKDMFFSISEKAYLKDKWNKAKDERLFSDSLQSFLNRQQKQRGDITKDTILQAKYHWYYNYLFAPKNQSVFNVIASTDSLMLDSLLNGKINRSIDINVGEKSKNNSLFNDGFLSDTYRYDSLSEDLQRVADSVKKKQWSKITKCKWGYVVLGLNQQKVTRVIPIEEAYDQLLQLPDTANLLVMLTEERKMDFFKENMNFFQRDTNFLSIKISPHLYKKNKANITSVIKPHVNVLEIRCTDRELPIGVRETLLNNIEHNKCDTTDWLDLEYGTWKIRIISKQSGKKVDFAEYRNCIIQLMKPALIQRQSERAKSINDAKKEEKSQRFYTDFYYTNLPGRFKNGMPDPATVDEINAWASQNLTIKIK